MHKIPYDATCCPEKMQLQYALPYTNNVSSEMFALFVHALRSVRECGLRNNAEGNFALGFYYSGCEQSEFLKGNLI